MKSKKIILLLTSLVSITVSVVFAVTLTSQETNAFFDPSTEMWGHYDQVLPGEGTPGCKEFWISCSSHEILFEAPQSGQIIDRGHPTLTQIQSWKNDGTDRYIYYVGDTLHFGSYPQSQETDQEIINLLNQNKDEWITLDEYNNETMETPYMFYKDVDLNNDNKFDYRGIYLTAYRGSMHYSSPTTSSNYQNNYGFEKNVNYWFKYEPIKWAILEKNNDNYKLLCNSAIDNIAYSIGTKSVLYDGNHYIDYQGDVSDDSIAHNNYKFSDIRNFLNTSFYFHAFSNDEKQLIKEVRIDNSADSIYWDNPTNYCEDTYDKVTLLSRKEAYNTNWGFLDTYALYKQNGNSYFNGSDITIDEKKQRFTTDYAKSLGAYIYTFDERWYGTADWFLRSPSSRPYDDDQYVYCIRSRGHAEETINIESTFASVVPVITIGQQIDNFTYAYNGGSDSYKITGLKNQNADAISIPNTHNGLPVTEIEQSAFMQNTNVKYAEIPGNIKIIGAHAFYSCTNLRKIILSPGIQEIKASAFSHCSSLKILKMPSSVLEIGDECFYGCSKLEAVTISRNILTIPEYLFSGCTSLVDLLIPEGVKTIKSYAFFGCSNLNSLVLPLSIKTIQSNVATMCPNLKNIYYFGDFYGWNDITNYDWWFFNDLELFYYSEYEPTDPGNYWHFDENNKIKRWIIVGSIVEFGKYPQNKINDESIIEYLENNESSWRAFDHEVFLSETETYTYTDYDLDNDYVFEYRKLERRIYNYETADFERITSWYKYEPIKWVILSLGNECELRSLYKLDISNFCDLMTIFSIEGGYIESYHYSDSVLRENLIYEFQSSAFTNEQRYKNLKSKSITYTYDYSGYQETLSDKVYLPDLNDIDDIYDSPKPTEYVEQFNDYLYHKGYWLRNPGQTNYTWMTHRVYEDYYNDVYADIPECNFGVINTIVPCITVTGIEF